MAVSSTYYLNGPSLGSATAVFTNAALTVCAPNGFYSDGVIVRELVGCVLLPQQTCPLCGVVPVWYELNKCSDSSVLYSEEYFQGDFQINERVTIPGGFVCIVVDELLIAPVGLLYLIATTGQTGCPVSYNCVEGNCVDPGDGTGTYSTLGACESACGVVESYNCVEGNCVDPGDGTGTYATLIACEAACGEPPAEINVTSVGGSMEPCSGGSIDDYMGANVSTDVNVTVNTNFVIDVYYVETGVSCSGSLQGIQTFNVTIPSGSNISTFNACSGGTYFPTGANICGACIVSCDNPSVSTIGFDCPL